MINAVTASDEYQREIAEQYKKRVSSVTATEVQQYLTQLGFKSSGNNFQPASIGNMSSTFLSPELVIKVNKDPEEQKFLPNLEVSEKLPGHPGMIEVLSYDAFEKTEAEVLVMKRSPGTCLQSDLFQLSEEELKTLFRQVLQVIQDLASLHYGQFGSFNPKEPQFTRFSDQLRHDFEAHCETILRDRLCQKSEVNTVRDHFIQQLYLFDDEQAVFVHHDVHMGNILHQGEQLTALLDFDASGKAPLITVLTTLLRFIENPSQFTEGTPDFAQYQGKSFPFLMPILEEELSDLFTDPDLHAKLKLLSISESLMWIAGNWSQAYNEEMMSNLLREI